MYNSRLQLININDNNINTINMEYGCQMWCVYVCMCAYYNCWTDFSLKDIVL